MSEICDVEGCDSVARPMGWCNKHYRRWKKYGDPERTPYNRAPNGVPEKFFREASESETNDCILWPYGKDGDGYGFISGKAVHTEKCVRLCLENLKEIETKPVILVEIQAV